ncbi:hypothetical protein VUJ46_09220 [Chryseobacterium sp. MYb264]|uniref:hypothetical protein n=1 Tax=Chryseobacterium sp. MYb264 TaxID=2745153 RepID=UPI002E0F6AA9|nr:hypothetical protein VUJ46_09220 [Chryseobacterium sp. MYb264]
MIGKNFISLSVLGMLCLYSCKQTETVAAATNSENAVPKKDSSQVAVAPPKVDTISQASPAVIDSLDAKEIQALEGKYNAKTCENGRFSIELTDKDGKKVGYKIYDSKKVIASGRAEISKSEKKNEFDISLGAMGGLLKGDTLVIQNYGNSMNEFDHFGQCADKYLNFIK